jgi:hypothetical protein
MRILIILSLLISVEAFALPLREHVGEARHDNIRDYQIGSEWGKVRVTQAMLNTESPAFVRAVSATGRLPVGGTGFYLGKFNDSHVIATNHHVCPTKKSCDGHKINFPVLKKKFKVTGFYITLPEIDLTLLKIKVKPEEEADLLKVAKNFSFGIDVTKGMELLTAGFGIGGNPGEVLMVNQDSDCKVYSENGEYRLMADPDTMNPGTYKAWSFAHSCDISHGDSGSAMVERSTGDVVGIVWTGKLPKSSYVQSSSALIALLQNPTEEIWEELAYAVPAPKIRSVLKRNLLSRSLDAEAKTVINSIISDL